eukprot:scaffold90790_cov75-Phaeocystis_antarctica.AAC.1
MYGARERRGRAGPGRGAAVPIPIHQSPAAGLIPDNTPLVQPESASLGSGLGLGLGSGPGLGLGLELGLGLGIGIGIGLECFQPTCVRIVCSPVSRGGKQRPVWPASAARAAEWPRVAEAGGHPGPDLAHAGRARGRMGRSLCAASRLPHGAVLASLNIFCSFVASVSARFCRNSARERDRRATRLSPSMLGARRAVPERAWCARVCVPQTQGCAFEGGAPSLISCMIFPLFLEGHIVVTRSNCR